MKNLKIKINKRIYFKAILLSVFSLVFCLPVFAAVLYLDPPNGEYYSGDNFIVNIRIDVNEECINTVKADLSFPKDILEIIDFSKGDSILTLWVEDPEINQDLGLISFAGGIPGGYCGRVSGDPGESNLLGKIIFKIRENEPSQAVQSLKVEFLDSSKVLLNDGKGTPAELTTEGAVFTVSTKPFNYIYSEDEWQKELEQDKTLPEPFTIEVRRFEEKYFLIFSTTDKQTGLDYYEISETKVVDIQPQLLEFKKGTSPYLLEDQSLQSIIKVKAVDKAGNERIVEIKPIESSQEKKQFSWWFIILIILVGSIIWWIKRKFKS